MPKEDAPMRADARRNRDRIVAAARDLFIERGADAPMEEIARRAGVGVGTLYRRFPDRTALHREVARHTAGRMRDLAESALAEEPDSWSALRRFVTRSCTLRTGPLKSIIDPDLNAVLRGDPELEDAEAATFTAVERIVTSAQDEGSLRRDVGSGDVIMLIGRLTCSPDELPPGLEDVAPARMVSITLDGLRAADPTELPGSPITTADLGVSR
ncbi:MAG TPA: helix-turn-helix domain-containing protein [Streptosporangiaceae bacterium]